MIDVDGLIKVLWMTIACGVLLVVIAYVLHIAHSRAWCVMHNVASSPFNTAPNWFRRLIIRNAVVLWDQQGSVRAKSLLFTNIRLPRGEMSPEEAIAMYSQRYAEWLVSGSAVDPDKPKSIRVRDVDLNAAPIRYTNPQKGTTC